MTMIPERLTLAVEHLAANAPDKVADWRAGWARAVKGGWDYAVRDVHDVYAVADGCTFDKKLAKKPGRFTRNTMTLFRGKGAGNRFELLPWLAEGFVEPLFGWIRPDGTRRFRTARLWVPKKNAKSMTCAALALYLGSPVEGEGSPQVYVAAVTRDQARMVFEPALILAKRSEILNQVFTCHNHINRINCPHNDGAIMAMAADGASAEGKDASAIIYDELHVWRDRAFWNSLYFAGAARKQPLRIMISTAGDDITSIGYEQYGISVQHRDALRTGYVDWTQLNLIYECPQELVKRWDTTEAWAAANPSAGHTIDLEEMGEAARAARDNPVLKSEFLRYRLNVWVQAANPWLDIKRWEECARPDLRKRLAIA